MELQNGYLIQNKTLLRQPNCFGDHWVLLHGQKTQISQNIILRSIKKKKGFRKTIHVYFVRFCFGFVFTLFSFACVHSACVIVYYLSPVSVFGCLCTPSTCSQIFGTARMVGVQQRMCELLGHLKTKSTRWCDALNASFHAHGQRSIL